MSTKVKNNANSSQLNYFNLLMVVVCAYVLITQPLYGLLRGKTPKQDTTENIWIYGNDKGERSLSFIAFENIAQDEAFQSFRSSIPKAIAETLRDSKILHLPAADYIPVMRSLEQYQVYRYDFSAIGADFSYEDFLEKQSQAASAAPDPSQISPPTPAADTGLDDDSLENNLRELVTDLVETGKEQLLHSDPVPAAPPDDETPAKALAAPAEVPPPPAPATPTSTDEAAAQTQTEPSAQSQDGQPAPPTEIPPAAENLPPTPDDEATSAATDEEKELTPMEKFAQDLLSTNFAYFLKDTTAEEYVIYHFSAQPSQYIDAQLVDDATLDTITAIPIETSPVDGRKFFALNTYDTKKLVVENKLYYLQGVPLLEAVDEIPSDYIVYGAYNVRDAQIQVNVYLIYKHDKKIIHIFSDTFPSFSIGEDLKKLSSYVLGALEQRQVVTNIKFVAKVLGAEENAAQDDVLFGLEDKLIGRLPVNIANLVENAYNYQIFKPGYKLKRIKSALPVDSQKFVAQKSDTTVEFELVPTADIGGLVIRTDDKDPASFYINQQLKATASSEFVTDNILPGSYYVVVENNRLGSRSFQVEILPQTVTELRLFSERQRKKRLNERKINYNLGARVSAAIGLTLLGAFFINRARTIELEDRIQAIQINIARGENETAPLEAQETSLTRQRNTSRVIDATVLTASLTALVTMMFMHSFDIWKNRIPIETKFSPKGDFEILYKKRIDLGQAKIK